MSSYHKGAWARVSRMARDRDGWRCRACGRAGRLEAHHVRPVHQGGDLLDLANTRALCRSCHIAIHRRQPYEGRPQWENLVRELTNA